MRRYLVTIFFAILIVSLPVLCEELKPYGFVNDFAGVLSPEAATGLEAQLRAYEQETSIEVAVVTVKTLEGLPIEGYAERLWKQWGLGKRGKDNGVMFLVAPSEHKMRIATGYGVEGDLTDLQCHIITDEKVKPFFRDNKMETGILAGADGIINTIGHLTPEARATKRAEKEKVRAEAQARGEKATGFFFTVLVGIIGVLIGVGAIMAVFIRMRRVSKERKAKLEHDKAEVLQFLRNFPERLEKAKKTLVDFPNLPLAVAGNLSAARNFYNAAQDSVRSGESTQIYDWVDNYERAQQANKLLDSVEEAVASEKNWRQAEKDSKKYFADLDKLLPETEKQVADKAVFSDNARKLVEEANSRLAESKKLSAAKEPNWMNIVVLLTAAITALTNAPTRTIAQEREEAKLAAEAAERHRKEEAARRKQEAEEESSRSTYYASSSSSSSSSSSDSSSSFSGFGGGSTGGGGASDSW